MAEQLKRDVEAYVVSMQYHIHMHKILHGAMLRTWEKWEPAHVNRRRITAPSQNSVCIASHLVQF